MHAAVPSDARNDELYKQSQIYLTLDRVQELNYSETNEHNSCELLGMDYKLKNPNPVSFGSMDCALLHVTTQLDSEEATLVYAECLQQIVLMAKFRSVPITNKNFICFKRMFNDVFFSIPKNKNKNKHEPNPNQNKDEEKDKHKDQQNKDNINININNNNNDYNYDYADVDAGFAFFLFKHFLNLLLLLLFCLFCFCTKNIFEKKMYFNIE
jgi:hypothetical protein